MAITQFFFDNADFYRFRDRCAAAGIDAPIIPGVLPIENFEKAARFAKGCGASVPIDYPALFAKATERDAAQLLATALCAEQCEDLTTRGGVEHLHFYTLNTPELTYDVCRALGVEAGQAAVAVAG